MPKVKQTKGVGEASETAMDSSKTDNGSKALHEPSTDGDQVNEQEPPKTLEGILAEQNQKINQLTETVGYLFNQGGYQSPSDYELYGDQYEDGDANGDDIESILRNNDNDMTGQEGNDEVDPAVKELLDELQQPNEFGPNVEKITAQAFQSIPTYQLSKETQEKWKLEYRSPENCPNLVVPLVNNEIWNCLPLPAKTTDAKYQALQQNLVRSLVAQTRAMDLIMVNVPKATLPLILKPQLDSAKLISLAIQDITQRRKNNLKSFMRPEYRSLCSAKLPVSKYLFGDNLEQSMKSVRATSSIVRPLNDGFHHPSTSSSHHTSFRRNHPYRQQFQTRPSGSLNYNRPPSAHFNRGGGQFRGPARPFMTRGQPKWNQSNQFQKFR